MGEKGEEECGELRAVDPDHTYCGVLLGNKLWNSVKGLVQKIDSIFFFFHRTAQDPLLPHQNPTPSTTIITQPLLLHTPAPLISSPTTFHDDDDDDDDDDRPSVCEDRLLLWSAEEIYRYRCQTIDNHESALDMMPVFVEENETPCLKEEEEEETKEKKKEKEKKDEEEKTKKKRRKKKQKGKEKEKEDGKEKEEEEPKKKWQQKKEKEKKDEEEKTTKRRRKKKQKGKEKEKEKEKGKEKEEEEKEELKKKWQQKKEKEKKDEEEKTKKRRRNKQKEKEKEKEKENGKEKEEEEPKKKWQQKEEKEKKDEEEKTKKKREKEKKDEEEKTKKRRRKKKQKGKEKEKEKGKEKEEEEKEKEEEEEEPKKEWQQKKEKEKKDEEEKTKKRRRKKQKGKEKEKENGKEKEEEEEPKKKWQQKKKKKKKKDKGEEEDEKKKKKKKKSVIVVVEERWIKHHCSRHRILLVGEGNFSFSVCLAKAFSCASNIIATSLDSEAFLKEQYGKALSNIEELKSRGSKVLHGIDASTMANHHFLRQLEFDRIVFNFPFAGFFTNMPTKSQLCHHRRLVRLFMKNAKEMIGEDGEIHISHKTNGNFHAQFKLESIASSHGLRLIEAVEFELSDYPGYNTKYGFGGDDNFNCVPSNTFKFALKTAPF